MGTITTRAPVPHGLETLQLDPFSDEIYSRLLLSIHHLKKPNIYQLLRLYGDVFKNRQALSRSIHYLYTKEGYIDRIKPVDLEAHGVAGKGGNKLPFVYFDTDKSRRYLADRYKVAYRATTDRPTRNYSYIYHDEGLADALISFELAARVNRLPFWYIDPHHDDGKSIFPKYNVIHDDLTAHVRPDPDKIFHLNGYTVITEWDCGSEKIKIKNVIKDATIARKFRVYHAMERTFDFAHTGWKKRIYLYIIEHRNRSRQSSQRRLKQCMSELPSYVDPQQIYFANKHHFTSAEDLTTLTYIRGDGMITPLPCFT